MDEANRAPVDPNPAAPRAGVSPQLLIVLGALALTALLYWPTSLEIVELWGDTDQMMYTHGWFVLAISVWLILRERRSLVGVLIQPSMLGGMAVIFGSLAWLICHLAGLRTPSILVLPAIVLASIWCLGGWSLMRLCVFPVAFLYFALPVWDPLAPVLQAVTAFVNLWLTRLAGIPVVMEEFVIHIPAGWFEVAGGCSGLRFFIVALGIAALDGHLTSSSYRARVLLIGLAGVLALITNWVRVFVIILVGHHTNMQHYLVREDHYYFGWVLFAISLVGYVYWAGRIPRHARHRVSIAADTSSTSLRKVGAAAVLSMLLMSIGPTWSFAIGDAVSPNRAGAPPLVRDWNGPALTLSDWKPNFPRADEEFSATYFQELIGDVSVYRAVYYSQRQGKELRGFGTSVAGTRYREIEATEREVRTDGGSLLVLERVIESDDGRRRLVWSLYAVDGKPTAMRLTDQVAYGVRSLFGPPQASVVALSAECLPDCDRARTVLAAFAGPALPELLTPNEPLGEES